ncbi:MAG: phenylalanine--tRNA ligase subunit alpha, partial [Sphingobium sp.]
MTETTALKSGLLADIAAANNLAAVEELRVGALGKQGVITALLKTLGGMSADERLEKGPAIQDLRESVTAAIAERKATLEQAALDARLASEKLDMTLPADIGPVG